MDQETTTKGKGKRRTAMKMIDNKRSLQVTFAKRRKGLLKKAEELSILCGIEIVVIAFSPDGKAFTFGNVDSAMNRLSTALRDVDDDADQEEEEGKDAMLLVTDGVGSKETADPSSMMMGDDELDIWLENLRNDGAWADSCFS